MNSGILKELWQTVSGYNLGQHLAKNKARLGVGLSAWV